MWREEGGGDIALFTIPYVWRFQHVLSKSKCSILCLLLLAIIAIITVIAVRGASILVQQSDGISIPAQPLLSHLSSVVRLHVSSMTSESE